jgi:hypothetical protein
MRRRTCEHQRGSATVFASGRNGIKFGQGMQLLKDELKRRTLPCVGARRQTNLFEDGSGLMHRVVRNTLLSLCN